jgi:heat shock protein HslJ
MIRDAPLPELLLVGLIVASTQCRPLPDKPAAGADRAQSPRPDSSTQAPSADTADLAGTAWRLVKFQGGDEKILKPDDPQKYTITFQPDGRLNARIDCNRGRGTWKSTPPQLEFRPLALTRALCPPGSLHDEIVKRWSYVRSYVIKDGPCDS